MNKEILYQQLAYYLDDKLSADERAALQHQIDTNEEVAKELALLRMEKELAALLIEEDLDKKMATWNKEMDQHTGQDTPPPTQTKDRTTKPSNPGKWLILLLACISIIGFYLYSIEPAPVLEEQQELPSSPPKVDDYQQAPGEPQEEENTVPPSAPDLSPQQPPVADQKNTPKQTTQLIALAEAQSDSPIDNILLRDTRSTNPKSENPIEKALLLLKNKELNAAQSVLHNVSKQPNEELYKNAQQYLAYLYFEQKQYELAIPILENLLSMNFYDKPNMEWYLSLAYLATKKEDAGRKLVAKIATSTDPDYKDLQLKAQSLLEKLP